MKDNITLRKEWGENAYKKLIGKKITDVRYMDESEMEQYGWDRAGVIIFLDGDEDWDSWLIPSRDGEGNGPGALFTSFEGPLSILPVI
jgi:hypothetical protein